MENNYDSPNYGNQFKIPKSDDTIQQNTNMGFQGVALGNGTILGSDPTPPSKTNLATIAGFLVSYSRTKSGDIFELREGNNSIGSSKTNTIRLTEKHVSSEHAKINISLGADKNWKIQVVDLSSANGTFVNNARLDIYAGYELKNNHKLKIGEYEFLLMVIDLQLLHNIKNENFVEGLKSVSYQSNEPRDANSTNIGI